jgi:hypothetical protein
MPEKTPEEVAAEKAAEAAEKAAAEVAALRAELDEEKTKRDAAEKLTRKSAAELQKLQTARKAADAGMTEEKLKELREEAKAEVLAELKPQLDAAATLKAQNRALTLDAVQKAKALKLGILPAKIEDFWTLRGGEFDLTEDGKPMVKGKPGLDPDKHLAGLLKLNPEWVQGTKAGGGGAGGITATGGPTGITPEEAMRNPSQLFAAANEAAS